MRESLLDRVASLCVQRPVHVLVVALVLCAVSAAALPSLEVSTSRFALIGGEQSFVDADGARTELVAAIRGDDPDRVRAAADALAQRLASELDQSRNVLHRIDPSLMGSRELLLLPPAELAALVAGAETGARLIDVTESARRAMVHDPEETLDALSAADAASPGDAQIHDAASIGNLLALLEEAERWQRDRSRETLVIGDHAGLAHASPVDSRGYFTSRDGRTRYVFVSPTEVTDRYAYVGPLVHGARALGAEVAEAHAVHVSFTGYPALAVDEIEAIQRGSLITGGVAAALVMALFALGFRSVGGVVVAGAPLGVGMLWAFGMIAAGVGHVNLLTQAAAPVFAGLGIDFAVHLLATYDAERRHGIEHREAARRMMCGPGKAVLTGGFTTAGAFLAMTVTEHQAFRELGLVAGLGLLIVMTAVLFLTPAILTLGERTGWPWLQLGRGETPVSMVAGGAGLVALLARRPRSVLVGVAAVTAGLAVGIPQLSFDPDVEALLPQDAESVVAAAQLRAQTTLSNEVLVTHAPDLDSLHEMSERLRSLPSVGRVESVASFVPPDLERQVDILRGQPSAHEPRAVERSLEDSLEGLGRAAGAIAADLRRTASEDVASQLASVATAAEALREDLDHDRVRDFDRALGAHAARVRRGVERARAGDFDTLSENDLPEAVRERLLDDGDGYPLYVYPAEDVFAEGALDRFLREVRESAPDVTGSPVDFAAFLEGMRASLTLASGLALAVVFVLLGADLRHPRDVLLALVPVVLGVTWLFGLMGWLGIPSNMANLAALPLVLGIGVDDGVHLIHRRRAEGDTPRALRSLLRALVLTTLTTVAGFGAIGLAAHRGMQSFALVMVIGAAGCLLATLVAVPALMQLVWPSAED